MADLPEQFTGEELQERFERMLERLQAQEIPEAPTAVEQVRGGELQRAARGAALVRVTSERVVDMPFYARTTTIDYTGLPEGVVQARTSPARLIKVGSRWREDGLLGPWSTRHDFHLEGRGSRLTYQVPQGEELAALPPVPQAERSDERARYEIPPAATKIQGHGTVRYRTGQALEVNGEQLLFRPLADGSLGVRPGGVYAVFESPRSTADDTPKALIGTRWTTLTPTDETE